MATWAWWRDDGEDDGRFEPYATAANQQLEQAYATDGHKARVTLKTGRGNYVVKYIKATSRRPASWVQHREGNARLWRLVERRAPERLSLVSDDDDEEENCAQPSAPATAMLTEEEKRALEAAEAPRGPSPGADAAESAPGEKDEATTEEDDWDEDAAEGAIVPQDATQCGATAAHGADGADDASDESIPLEMGGAAAGETSGNDAGSEVGGEDESPLVHSSDLSAGQGSCQGSSSAPFERGDDEVAATQEWRDVEETEAGEGEVEVEVHAEAEDGDATEEDEEDEQLREPQDDEACFLARAPPAMLRGEARTQLIDQVRFILQQTPAGCAEAVARLEAAGGSGDEYAFFTMMLRERAQLQTAPAPVAPVPAAKRQRSAGVVVD